MFVGFLDGLIFLFPFILPPGRHAAADMPLLHIADEHSIHPLGQFPVDIRQPFSHILVHRGLRNPKPLCCLPHGRIVVYDIICDGYCPLLDILFQSLPLKSLFLQCMRGRGVNMTRRESPYFLFLISSRRNLKFSAPYKSEFT